MAKNTSLFKHIIWVVVIILFLTIGVAIGAIWWLIQPVSSTEVELSRFVVPRGQSLTRIAQRLTEEKYIRNPLVFRLIAQQQGLASKLQAGSFEISPHMTPAEIANALTKGSNDVWITVLEGWRVEEIADMLDRQELDDFSKQQFLALAKGKEGQLYPDTYLIPKQATAESIFNLLTSTFSKKITAPLEDEIAASQFSLPEILTLASIIEREARGEQQMRQVAGVLLNRLLIGMPLQVDATLQYIKGYNQQSQQWWSPPLAADKSLESGFNTYLNPGLPPAPIANPSLTAVEAVLNPLKSDNLYYIHDSAGRIHFAATLDEHNANVNRYLR